MGKHIPKLMHKAFGSDMIISTLAQCLRETADSSIFSCDQETKYQIIKNDNMGK